MMLAIDDDRRIIPLEALFDINYYLLYRKIFGYTGYPEGHELVEAVKRFGGETYEYPEGRDLVKINITLYTLVIERDIARLSHSFAVHRVNCVNEEAHSIGNNEKEKIEAIAGGLAFWFTQELDICKKKFKERSIDEGVNSKQIKETLEYIDNYMNFMVRF